MKKLALGVVSVLFALNMWAVSGSANACGYYGGYYSCGGYYPYHHFHRVCYHCHRYHHHRYCYWRHGRRICVYR